MTTKYPAGVMAICVVSSEGYVLNHIFAKHTKYNATVYCKDQLDKNRPLDEGQGCWWGACLPTGLRPSPYGEEDCQLVQGPSSPLSQFSPLSPTEHSASFAEVQL